MPENENPANLPSEELEWISLHRDLHKANDTVEESTRDKMMRKLKSNPLIPIGCLITTAVLAGGLYNFFKGNSVMSQRMMRLRIVAQSSTVAAIIGTVFLAGSKEK